ncbi:type II toxin-antitoxin system RelE/ParE family toxin [Hydrogenophilus thermoluteolus]|nr:type II toxin-antitoxin system RelE/ParE family toxin [Hydrogenophilus thermoluteolus]
MIRSFADEETEKVWRGTRSRRLPPNIHEGQWSIRINAQWHLCVLWNDGAAEAVEVCDYH